MTITLTRTGGIIPITKQAQTEVNWTDDELDEILKAIKLDGDAGNNRDATGYELKCKSGTFSVDLEKVPPAYKNTFDILKDNLKVMKM